MNPSPGALLLILGIFLFPWVALALLAALFGKPDPNAKDWPPFEP